MILPGGIYCADLGEAAPHPVLVVSREELNRGRTVMVVFITSARYSLRSILPNCVPFSPGEFGMTKSCVAQCENTVALDVADLDLAHGPIGVLDEARMRDVIRALGFVVDADCEPN